jgi:hypothetical protein
VGALALGPAAPRLSPRARKRRRRRRLRPPQPRLPPRRSRGRGSKGGSRAGTRRHPRRPGAHGAEEGGPLNLPLPLSAGEGGPKPKAWGVRVLLTMRKRPSPPTASRRAPPLPRKAGEGLTCSAASPTDNVKEPRRPNRPIRVSQIAPPISPSKKEHEQNDLGFPPDNPARQQGRFG